MPRFSPCLLLVALALIPSTSSADVVIAPSSGEGSTTDLFDVSRGTVVTGSTALAYAAGNGSDARAALGGSSSFIEPTHVIFENDGVAGATIDSIDFHTATAVDLRSFQLILSDDSNVTPFGDRGVAWFRLLGGQTADALVPLAGSALMTNYTSSYGNSQITYSSTVGGLGLQYFRLELARTTSQGPRIIELDGYSTIRLVPEPASVVLAGLGIASVGLLALRRRGWQDA